jgi:hypothetical protein
MIVWSFALLVIGGVMLGEAMADLVRWMERKQ